MNWMNLSPASTHARRGRGAETDGSMAKADGLMTPCTRQNVALIATGVGGSLPRNSKAATRSSPL